MPNFLGSHASFGKKFAQPISKGQQVGASASAISSSMERLKVLHQQVLPFILRRQKEQVLKELPPKTISDIPCSLTSEQRALYASLCQRTEVQCSISALKNTLDSANDQKTKLGSDAFKSLLYLRLVCTHPSLVTMSTSNPKTRQNDTSQLQRSGKLRALGDLLRTAGIAPRDLTAADYDASSLYVDAIPCAEVEKSLTTDSSRDDHKVSVFDNPFMKMTEYEPSNNKCLIFAQFIRSLDIVEKFLLNDHMPSVRYLRLDGKVASKERSVIVERFNQDETVRILLLTTRVGGLGLNLTGANIVVLLEHDFNPFADLQAMDRAHRIGQGKTVQVYRLVTSDTIEEKIMALQKSKIQTSNAIVNTDNSSMYSMGTDRLLDIFTLRSEMGSRDESSKRESKPVANSTWDVRHLNDLLDDTEEEYQSLGVEAFLQDLRHS
jgi:TATA-binding protein-associated factor